MEDINHMIMVDGGGEDHQEEEEDTNNFGSTKPAASMWKMPGVRSMKTLVMEKVKI